MATGRWLMGRLGRVLLAGSVISTGWLLLDVPSTGAATGAGATATPTATVSVVETTATANINGRSGLATVHLILNESGASTDQVHLFGILSDGTKLVLKGSAKEAALTNCKDSGGSHRLGSHRAATLQICGPTLVTLTFAVADPTISSGTLQVVSDGTTSNVALTITRTPPAWSVTLVLGAAGLIALLTIFWAGAKVTRRRLRAYLLDPNWLPRTKVQKKEDADDSLRKHWKDPLSEAADWKFDSWASNLSAIGALAGATFGASGSLNNVFPGVSSTTFVVLSIVFGVLIAAAPFLFNTITTADSAEVPEGQSNTVGTVGGFMVSGSLTAAAALGEIGTIGLLVIMGGISGVRLVGVGAVLAISALLTMWYLFVTMKSGTTHGRSYTKPATSATRLATEEARKAPPAKPSKAGVRVALL